MHDQAAGQVLWGEEIVKWWKLTCRKFVGKWKQQDWQRVSWTAISETSASPWGALELYDGPVELSRTGATEVGFCILTESSHHMWHWSGDLLQVRTVLKRDSAESWLPALPELRNEHFCPGQGYPGLCAKTVSECHKQSLLNLVVL